MAKSNESEPEIDENDPLIEFLLANTPTAPQPAPAPPIPQNTPPPTYAPVTPQIYQATPPPTVPISNSLPPIAPPIYQVAPPTPQNPPSVQSSATPPTAAAKATREGEVIKDEQYKQILAEPTKPMPLGLKIAIAVLLLIVIAVAVYIVTSRVPFEDGVGSAEAYTGAVNLSQKMTPDASAAMNEIANNGLVLPGSQSNAWLSNASANDIRNLYFNSLQTKKFKRLPNPVDRDKVGIKDNGTTTNILAQDAYKNDESGEIIVVKVGALSRAVPDWNARQGARLIILSTNKPK